ncbi:DUF2975 domain-containing protein [Croceicoccus mobilis]|uniref:DUF2975 domain-containing protein n=1 Tax=Croceicoccus mobilis TaxID=1703339 RepID=A0A916Z1A6_9SPHN|nr:DUF2975 domain-containing protein [Croceicoccus mobilis]GGD71113.1 hypothetical protein GCM10010990_20740 [Croceicoccus mobilis]
MTQFRNDPLLAIARFLLTFGLAVTVIALAAIAITIPAIGIFYSQVSAELVANDAPSSAYWVILLMLMLVAGLLVMAFFFIRHLRRIVDTVAQGDPFVPINATRLTSMAWLSLGMFLIAIPIEASGAWLSGAVEHAEMQGQVGVEGSSLFLILTLFILARVFRKGAEMREELEGTV